MRNIINKIFGSGSGVPLHKFIETEWPYIQTNLAQQFNIIKALRISRLTHNLPADVIYELDKFEEIVRKNNSK
jgi:hypothetical protein